MNIHEYQAKRIFSRFGIRVPSGMIAYTPNEAREAGEKTSLKGPWIVKAQIQSDSRCDGKFSDKRAGKKGGIRISKNLDEVYSNADNMLENMLITNQTGAKGRLVSRVYVEEYIKVCEKYYLGITIDKVNASVVIIASSVFDMDKDNFIDVWADSSEKTFKLDIGVKKNVEPEDVDKILDFVKIKTSREELKDFINKILKVFYEYDASLLEVNPIGVSKDGKIWALDAKICFDKNALYKHKDICLMADESEIEEREIIASKFGFQYKELNSGIGIIVNGDGLALNTINEARNMGMDTACFLNLKGGVDRDKIAMSLKLIMTNPKVDGIFINILGGFLRCNLIADGIINVANDLGLNIPLIVRFEGTNKAEATEILEKSGLALLIAEDTQNGLCMLKKAIEEDI